MLDFEPVRRKQKSLSDLARGLTRADLGDLTREMVEAQLEVLEGVEDADVVFVPEDPEADDTFADDAADINLAWTLGHVVVHQTASSEEAAAHALTLARGVVPHERSRYEVPWREATTVAYCRARLRESLRMRLAMLEAWPEQPHLETVYVAAEGAKPRNAVERFLSGLVHDDAHLQQMRKIVAQARVARGVAA